MVAPSYFFTPPEPLSDSVATPSLASEVSESSNADSTSAISSSVIALNAPACSSSVNSGSSIASSAWPPSFSAASSSPDSSRACPASSAGRSEPEPAGKPSPTPPLVASCTASPPSAASSAPSISFGFPVLPFSPSPADPSLTLDTSSAVGPLDPTPTCASPSSAYARTGAMGTEYTHSRIARTEASST